MIYSQTSIFYLTFKIITYSRNISQLAILSRCVVFFNQNYITLPSTVYVLSAYAASFSSLVVKGTGPRDRYRRKTMREERGSLNGYVS
jgi:hypothetical protein